MNGWLWVVGVLLGLAFAGAGLVKLTKSRAQLAEARMEWVEDFSDSAVKGIGALEVLAAVGLVLAPLVGAGLLVPLAAIGLMALMVGAAVTHHRRGEQQLVAVNGTLFLVALFVAWGRLFVAPL